LNKIRLENYIYLINDSQNSHDLKIEALRSIVLSAMKNQNLLEFVVVEILIENIKNF
jgi:hypothetical protein